VRQSPQSAAELSVPLGRLNRLGAHTRLVARAGPAWPPSIAPGRPASGRIGDNAVMAEQSSFGLEQARAIGERVGIDWSASRFDAEQFRMGLDVELEHGRRDVDTNVSDDDETTTGKIALAHLNEFPDYYTRLENMEEEAKRHWQGRT
jgi:hypothetical protein